MTSTSWALVQVAARLLEPNERETVLGDLLETGEGGWRGLRGVVGLVVRRQVQLLRSWRPWAASFGLTLPGSLLLMGFSVSIASTCERLAHELAGIGGADAIHEPWMSLLCRGLLLIAGSWICGYVVGSVSRKTLWMSAACCCGPCLFCLVRFREPSLSKFSLFLFLLPAVWGVRQALRLTRINLSLAILLAIATTVLTMLPANSRGVWLLNWSLVWPAWYVVAMARLEGVKEGEMRRPEP